MQHRLELAPDRRAVRRARALVDDVAPSLPRAIAEDLRIVLSELVGNAVEHGPRRAPIVVTLSVSGALVRGEVTDQGDGVVEIREAADEGGGYGLRLVDRIASRWGVFPGSTHVWFELGVTGG